jgi:hypothetical protein
MVVLLALAAATPEIRYFRYERPLSAPVTKAGQTCVALDAGIFARAAPGLADLRLYRDTTETPYVVREAMPMEQQQPKIEPLNLGSRNGQTVFDATMPEGHYSDVELDVAGTDFIATVKVTGSQTQGSAGTKLGAYTIFDLTGQKLGRSTVLHLPESDFRYLHFTIAGKVKPGDVSVGGACFGEAALRHRGGYKSSGAEGTGDDDSVQGAGECAGGADGVCGGCGSGEF